MHCLHTLWWWTGGAYHEEGLTHLLGQLAGGGEDDDAGGSTHLQPGTCGRVRCLQALAHGESKGEGFPVPVLARPTRSWHSRTGWKVDDWMGKAWVMPFFCKRVRVEAEMG